MVKVYYINVKTIDRKTLDGFYLGLSKERKEKVDRLRFDVDKRLSIMAEVLLKYALKNEGIELKKILIDKNGKPYINEIHFNISHSNNYVALAISKEEVGCDIEKITDINLDIAKRYFSDEEYKEIMACENREKLFFRYWTLKESFLKAIGYGLNKPLDSFTIKIGKEITIEQNLVKDNFYFFEYKTVKDYAFSVCSKEREIEFFNLNVKDIQ
ncbi:MAG: 4'-phosphopantetheinyl transferase superfamily protein [Firmicutes bacterium]|nr:4'-phosphopantetheinyl transferase superfamily protein [Candidatus Caballimonas caccae]